MTIKQIAKTFDMSIESLAKCMGYSRQAFYNAGCMKNKTRAQAAIDSLRNLNAVLYQQERETALRRFQARSRAAKALEKILLNGGESSDA